MAILLCAATNFEIAPTLAFLEKEKLYTKVDVLLTGIGMLPATYQLARRIAFGRPQLVIQAGVAGGFDEAVALGTTLAVLRETVGDMGVMENNSFTDAFRMGLLNPHEAPWQNGRLENKHAALLQQTGLLFADAVTVNEISTAGDRISYYKNGVGATLESMEGAALHYTCLLEDVPFLQLRALSNYVGERNKEQWQMQAAVENLNENLQRILNSQLDK